MCVISVDISGIRVLNTLKRYDILSKLSKSKCHLINPAKSELGKIAKIVVENINKTVRKVTLQPMEKYIKCCRLVLKYYRQRELYIYSI